MTNMTPQEAVNAVQKFAKQFEAVLALAELVDDANKINQLASEAQIRLSGYDAKEKEAQAQLYDLNKKIEETKARDALVSGKLTADAQEAAARTIEQARFEAQSILAQAEKIAADKRSKVDADVAPLIKKATEATSEWVDLSGKIEAGKKELSDLQAKIDNARDTIAALMRV